MLNMYYDLNTLYSILCFLDYLVDLCFCILKTYAASELKGPLTTQKLYTPTSHPLLKNEISLLLHIYLNKA